MKISIAKARRLCSDVLAAAGFEAGDAARVTDNLLDAELSGKHSHGLVILPYLKEIAPRLNLQEAPLEVLKATGSSLFVDGQGRVGCSVLHQALDRALELVEHAKMVWAAVSNVGMTGFLGAYARRATQQDLIFVGFSRSPGGLVPHGAKAGLWGTNPLTVGIPTHDVPVVLDMASSTISFAEVLDAQGAGRTIEEGLAVDADGNPSRDPSAILAGGALLPFAGAKGSGLAFVCELLGGALTATMTARGVPTGWGYLFALVDPTLFRPLQDFKADVAAHIEQLKAAPRSDGLDEIFFAGERSHALRERQLQAGEIEIRDELLQELQAAR